MNRLRLGLIATLLTASVAHAEVVGFTRSTVNGVSLTPSQVSVNGSYECINDGFCSKALYYGTEAGGQLTVTAKDGTPFDTQAYAFQSKDTNAGLGVVTTGYNPLTRQPFVFDADHSLSSPFETLTLTFSKAVTLSTLYFFPNNRSTYALTHELDAIDGFTLSVNGGSAVEYSFGSQGNVVNLAKPLVGTSFTLGYAKFKSPENFYLAGVGIQSIAAVPEPGTWGLMGLGLMGIALARRRIGTHRA